MHSPQPGHRRFDLMARTYARIYGAIWQDPDFCQLTANAQRVYILALSQPGVSFCGVVSYTARRWASMAADTKPATVTRAVRELEEAGFVLVDPRTEELFIRTFIRHDGIAGSPNLIVAMWKDAPGIFSPMLRSAFLAELPEEMLEGMPEGFAEGLPEPPPKGCPTPYPYPYPYPYPLGESDDSRPKGSKKGTRIPDEFVVTDEMAEWAKAECPDVDRKLATGNFVDYWKSKAGAGAVKLDWERTWKVWIRNEQKRVPAYANTRGRR